MKTYLGCILSLSLSLILTIFLFPNIAKSTPDTDTPSNYFGETPPATYYNIPPYTTSVYLLQSYEWLGTYKTSWASPPAEVPNKGPDDGISFGSLAAGNIGTLTYTIKTGAYTGIEYFYVWADWNNNGNWLDTDELIIDLDLSVSANSTLTNPVSFLIPAYYDSNLVGGDIWFNAVVSPNNSTAGISGSWLRGEQEAFKVNVQPIPEPATILLMICGLFGLVGIVIRQRRKREMIR